MLPGTSASPAVPATPARAPVSWPELAAASDTRGGPLLTLLGLALPGLDAIEGDPFRKLASGLAPAQLADRHAQLASQRELEPKLRALDESRAPSRSAPPERGRRGREWRPARGPSPRPTCPSTARCAAG